MLANGPDSFIWWEWVGDHRDDMWTRTQEHVQLTVFAVVAGLLIASALAACALRFRWTYAPITWTTGIMYTIPSLALFAFLVPYTGLGFKTAEIGLISYTLLILVRNIVAGVDGVPPPIREAADGMGYTRWRRFFTIELRLATPTIIAGIRIATVTVVGLVTITALVGEGGYGAFINDGLSRQFSTPIVVGVVLSVALAVTLDVLLLALERITTPWARRGTSAR
jgi:osmoprotectant transport system permease protein